jgi:hypothetical protein
MKRVLTPLVIVVAFIAMWAPSAGAESASASSLLGRLPIASEAGSSTYDRELFPHWVDTNGDCQDTRAEVLIAESWVAPTFTSGSRCSVASGRWYSWYDGAVWTAPGDVDIDHLVALKEAWESGARNWTTDRRRQFANDLDYPVSLFAITDNVNQSKSDRDPAEWLPPLPSARCDYAIHWVRVKIRRGLSIDPAERNALAGILSGSCGARVVEAPPVVK